MLCKLSYPLHRSCFDHAMLGLVSCLLHRMQSSGLIHRSKLLKSTVCLCSCPLVHGVDRSRTIDFTRRLPPGRTSTTYIVWEQDHGKSAHAIRVWRIYIHIYIQTRTDYTARLEGAGNYSYNIISGCKFVFENCQLNLLIHTLEAPSNLQVRNICS